MDSRALATPEVRPSACVSMACWAARARLMPPLNGTREAAHINAVSKELADAAELVAKVVHGTEIESGSDAFEHVAVVLA